MTETNTLSDHRLLHKLVGTTHGYVVERSHYSGRPLPKWVAGKLHPPQLALEVAQSTQLQAKVACFEKERPRIPTMSPTGSFVLLDDPPSIHNRKLLPAHPEPNKLLGHHKDMLDVRNLIPKLSHLQHGYQSHQRLPIMQWVSAQRSV